MRLQCMQIVTTMLDTTISNMAVAKLDFRNAFNTIRRDSMLEAVHNTLP